MPDCIITRPSRHGHTDMKHAAIEQLRSLEHDGSLTASEFRKAILWLGACDRSAILAALGQLSADDVRSLIGGSEFAGVPFLPGLIISSHPDSGLLVAFHHHSRLLVCSPACTTGRQHGGGCEVALRRRN